MDVSIASQLTSALISAILGLCLGALYDIIRIWRALLGIRYVNKFTRRLKEIRLPLIKNPLSKSKKENKIAENIIMLITDILYFLLVTFVMMIFIYHINSGIVRWYIFAGVIIGFFIYYFTLGKIVISFSEYVVFGIKTIRSYLFFFISRPFLPISRKIKNILPKLKYKIKEKRAKKKINKIPQDKRKELMKIGKN